MVVQVTGIDQGAVEVPEDGVGRREWRVERREWCGSGHGVKW
jgi:hypothetical protein